MTKEQMLELIKVLSALEAWTFGSNSRLPDYLIERIDTCIESLVKEVLK